MSSFSRFLAIAAAILFAAACTDVKIEGNLKDAPSADIVVKLLNINKYEILDTVKTDESGYFKYKFEVKEGQPEFVYLFHNQTKIASLLLQSGDKVNIQADTLGNYTVTGSEESQKLAQLDINYSTAYHRLETLAAQLATANAKEAKAINEQLGREYVNYYRECVKYVLTNSHSLTVVPVFYQKFGPEIPVFGQITDALHFRSVADSLETVYPDSKYVKALRSEADKRYSYLELHTHLSSAQEIGFPEIVLPDINGNKVKLSEVDSKVTMIFFWSPSYAAQNMFNHDVLKSIYNDYHKRGFEIYQVAIEPDKALWASVVKGQNLPWVNVCDALGSDSPYVLHYNLYALPAAYIIKDGELVDGQIVDEKSLRKLLDKLLK